MLLTTDLVKVADTTPEGKKAGKVKYHGTFTRPYLSHGDKDEIDTETVKVPDSNGSEVSYDITSPKDKKTTADSTDLLKSALDYLSSEQDKAIAASSNPTEAAAKKIDPVLILLQYADDGLVSTLRMKKRNELIPTVIDVDKAVLKFAEGLMQTKPGKYADLNAAVAAAKALFA